MITIMHRSWSDIVSNRQIKKSTNLLEEKEAGHRPLEHTTREMKRFASRGVYIVDPGRVI